MRAHVLLRVCWLCWLCVSGMAEKNQHGRLRKQPARRRLSAQGEACILDTNCASGICACGGQGATARRLFGAPRASSGHQLSTCTCAAASPPPPSPLPSPPQPSPPPAPPPPAPPPTWQAVGTGICTGGDSDFTAADASGLSSWALHTGLGWRDCSSATNQIASCKSACLARGGTMISLSSGCCFMFKNTSCSRNTAYTTYTTHVYL